jgi:major vault protein
VKCVLTTAFRWGRVQDYKKNESRHVFGTGLVMLSPDEEFTVLNLSGETPKRPKKIQSLALFLGPDFMTDEFHVETSDHTRLNLRLSYNWQFSVESKSKEDVLKIFSVPDFVGDACKAIASRVRAGVASKTFDEFHKNSAKIIRSAVFGKDEKDSIRDEFHFSSNNLLITNIDIQAVEPIDEELRSSLQTSSKLAVKITTDAMEADARQKASILDQKAHVELEKSQLESEQESEKQRKKLLEIQAQSKAVETSGLAVAEAKAKAEAEQIRGESSINQAENKAKSQQILAERDLDLLQKQREAETGYKEKLNHLEVDRERQLSDLRANEFEKMVKAITPETLKAMAQAGPELQAKLLGALGAQSLIITDGKTPLNLLSGASNLVPLETPASVKKKK